MHRSFVREIGRQVLEQAAGLQEEITRQKKVVIETKQQYGLSQQINFNDPIDIKITYLKKVLVVSDNALPEIEDKKIRSDRIQEKSNLGTLLQYAIIETCDEGVYLDRHLNKVRNNKKEIERYQDECCCMPWCAEWVATNFVEESHKQVEDRLEMLKSNASLQSKKSVVQQLELSSSSDLITEKDRL